MVHSSSQREAVIEILQQFESQLSNGYHLHSQNPRGTLGRIADRVVEVLQTIEPPLVQNLQGKLDVYLKSTGDRQKALIELEHAIEQTTAGIHKDKTLRVPKYLLEKLENLRLEAVRELIETQKAAEFVAPDVKPEKPLVTLQNA